MASELPPWNPIPGRCGACTKFRKDFGGSTGKVYGHCGVRPRAGSITSTDFKCDVYVSLEALADEEPAAPARPEPRPRREPARSPSPPPRRRRPAEPAKILKRPAASVSREAAPTGESSSVSAPSPPPSVVVEQRARPMDSYNLRAIVREAIEESLGLGEVDMVDRFLGGRVIVEPGNTATQSKEIPIDALMRKIVMVRDNLRVLEQKINGHDKLDDADRIQLQQYITRCYGSLTTFNFLFKNKSDRFSGSGSR